MNLTIDLNRKGIRIGGKYQVLLCASCFYFRIPHELWRDRIRKLKRLGYNCVDVYFPWNFHEPTPGNWRFEGDADANAFLDILADEHMFVVARPGPYICSEWDGGGIPAWILTAGSPIRQEDATFLAATAEWYAKILPVIASHEITRGGTVVLFQIENELDFFDCPNPAAYMEKLRRLAREGGITVPITGCAGQGDVKRATGLVPGIVPTYNFYPDAADSSFDGVASLASETIASLDLPLLISETGGDHFLLRREFANGARLLGAYNQVGGVNFGFSNSVNNWGPRHAPLSLITTEYGSINVINSYGEYTKHAWEGRLFASFLETFGERLASAVSRRPKDLRVSFDGGPVQELSALVTDAGESFVCVPNFGEEDAEAAVTIGGETVKAVVPAHTAPFWGFHVGLDAVAEGLELFASTVEIIDIKPGRIVCYGGDGAFLRLRLPGGNETLVSGYGIHTVSGTAVEITVFLLSREDASARLLQQTAAVSEDTACAVALENGLLRKGFPPFAELPAGHSLFMEQNGVYRGFVQYEAEVERGRPVVVSDAADFISAYDGKTYLGTRIGKGTIQKYPAAQAEDWRFRVESWGHSNFDDPRLPALRMTSPKGIGGVFSVLRVDRRLRWRFVLCEKWLPAHLELETSPFDALLPPDSWNSTRTPLLAAYYTDFTPEMQGDAFAIELNGNKAETAIYVDGELVGVFNPYTPWIPITPYVQKGRTCRLTLLCRKRDWMQPVGKPALYHLKAAPVRMYALEEDALLRLSAEGGVQTELPLTLCPGETAVLDLGLDGVSYSFGHAVAEATDLKLTAMFNGHVVGRVVGDFPEGPALHGGDPCAFYLPAPWFRPSGNRLHLLLEGIGPKPQLSSLRLFEISEGQKLPEPECGNSVELACDEY